MNNKIRPLLERFEEKVNKTEGCWLWTAKSTVRGYGQIGEGGKGNRRLLLAHRASYLLYIGPIPSGMEVCHRCDNPSCVRPDHLFLGTHADNMFDAMLKRRPMGPKRKPVCERGHTYPQRWHGRQVCNICHALNTKRRRTGFIEGPTTEF